MRGRLALGQGGAARLRHVQGREFLPLDGGHVFWALAEKVRGKRIPFEVMERAGVVGFALILIVFAIGLSNDISTLTGPGFNVR